VSEDELPPEGDKRRKSGAKSSVKSLEKKVKTEGGSK
jgi:hypothetical protein